MMHVLATLMKSGKEIIKTQNFTSASLIMLSNLLLLELNISEYFFSSCLIFFLPESSRVMYEHDLLIVW